MIGLRTIEFWIMILLFVNFFLFLLLWVVMKKINRLAVGEVQTLDQEPSNVNRQARSTASDIIEMLEPLVEESRDAAIRFEEQIKEKKRLLNGLNDAIDSRIISINLLLSRADTLHKKLEARSLPKREEPDLAATMVFDQQNRILEMHRQNHDVDTIARELSVPRGEVLLVVDLKKKFMEMEKNRQ